ncbi:hypothetical protein DMUE_1727 [Dictyocoela muelleri]|nr:hypothetical protein DMUE_1727 [Dictyocoela muelleri]
MQYFINLPTSTQSNVFLSKTNAINFLIEKMLLDEVKNCCSCGKPMFLRKSNKYNNNINNRCTSRICKRISIFHDKLINIPIIPINNYFLAIYEILCRDLEKKNINP